MNINKINNGYNSLSFQARIKMGKPNLEKLANKTIAATALSAAGVSSAESCLSHAIQNPEAVNTVMQPETLQSLPKDYLETHKALLVNQSSVNASVFGQDGVSANVHSKYQPVLANLSAIYSSGIGANYILKNKDNTEVVQTEDPELVEGEAQEIDDEKITLGDKIYTALGGVAGSVITSAAINTGLDMVSDTDAMRNVADLDYVNNQENLGYTTISFGPISGSLATAYGANVDTPESSNKKIPS